MHFASPAMEPLFRSLGFFTFYNLQCCKIMVG